MVPTLQASLFPTYLGGVKETQLIRLDGGSPMFRKLLEWRFGIWPEYRDVVGSMQDLCPPAGFRMVPPWVFPRSVFARKAGSFSGLWFTTRWKDGGCSLSPIHSPATSWLGFTLFVNLEEVPAQTIISLNFFFQIRFRSCFLWEVFLVLLFPPDCFLSL